MSEFALPGVEWIEWKPYTGPPLHKPRLVYLGNDEIGAARCEYECPDCGQRGPRYQPLARHMGLVMNVPASCPTVRALDDARRASARRQGEFFQ